MRYLTTSNPANPTGNHDIEGPGSMHQTLHQNDIHDLVQDRIGDLYSTARELREGRRTGSERDSGLVSRTRSSIGRRLVSIGQTVAGTHA